MKEEEIFLSIIQKYPLTFKKFEEFHKKKMIEPLKTEDDWRECIYDFIKSMAFRVHINYLPEQQVLVELYFGGNFLSAFEGTWIINEIYKQIFIDSFEEMEKWFQEISHKRISISEKKFKGKLLVR